MSPSEWVDFDHTFEYQKQFYDVMLPSGEIVLACWPNNGVLVRTHGHEEGSKDVFTVNDYVQIRVSENPRPWRSGNGVRR